MTGIVTQQLVAAGKLLDMPVHDHIIMAGDGGCPSSQGGSRRAHRLPPRNGLAASSIL